MSTFHGRIKNGIIVLDGATTLPEGTEVVVEILDLDEEPGSEEQLPTIFERLRSIVGIAKDLPPDAATNIDHYLYGLPKK